MARIEDKGVRHTLVGLCKNNYCEHRNLNGGDCTGLSSCSAAKAYRRMDNYINPKSGHKVEEIQEYWERQKTKILTQNGKIK